MSTDQPLIVFGPDHVGAIVVTGLATACLCFLLRQSDPHGALRRVICYGLAGLLIASGIAGQIYQAFFGRWTIDKSLPLHLCNLGTFVASIALILSAAPSARDRQVKEVGTPGRSLRQVMYELTYFWGIGGTTQGLLTPEIEDTFPSVPYLVFFATHGGIIAAAFVLTLGLRLRPWRDSLPRVWVITLVTATLVFVFNRIAGTNYMYLSGPPDRPSLYDYFGPWPWSLITLAAVGTAVFGLCYLPFWIMDRARREPAASMESAR